LGFGPAYQKELPEANNFLIYNPERDVPLVLATHSDLKLLVIRTAITKLHALFVDSTPALPFLSGENLNRKFYEAREVPPRLLVPLNQLFAQVVHNHAHKVLCKGKVYEVFGLYFSGNPEDNAEACPFLKDEASVRKIKIAKDLILKRMQNPPTLSELALEVGLNEFRLKMGFKEVYGNTVYGFLLDHKMEHARLMLDNDQHKINEVAFALGYNNPSHFIAAFKKKYGVTPKQYTLHK
jgi:AraC-like DNA-binding protein